MTQKASVNDKDFVCQNEIRLYETQKKHKVCCSGILKESLSLSRPRSVELRGKVS